VKSLLNFREHAGNLRQLLLWTLLVVPVGILSGSASAFFLWALDRVTEVHWRHGWLLFLLPLAGVVVGWVYHRLGKSAEGGNNLILDQIHEPGGGVPTRMAPLILISTLVTHLFGGSAGREGTAVQMGGSLASAYGRLCKFGEDNMRILLMAGVAAGFGSVFGTPLTGAVFAMEVLVIGRVQYDALIPVLVASVVGDATCSAWGIHHAIYHIGIADGSGSLALLDGSLMAKVVLVAIAAGLTSKLFAELTHGLQRTFKKIAPSAPLRGALGGVLVIGLVYLVGTHDYLGLGVRAHDPGAVTLLSAFTPGEATPWSWWWKLLFTAVTLAAGFKGGEVTPLFFMGAALGNTLAGLLGAPVDLFAGLGFIAVFAGATNTPLACTIMGIELFGSHYTVYFSVACFVAYYFSGHSGIYTAQRLGASKKTRSNLPPDLSLREVHELHAESNGYTFWDAADRLSFFARSPSNHESMKDHHIVTREFGKIRIYLAPRDRVPVSGFWDRLNAKPIYRELIKEAKKDGLNNAAAFMTHFGFTNGGKIHTDGAETPNPNLTMCVELIDHKDKLEAFCRQHGALLKGKTIVYKHVEHWDIRTGELVEKDASPSEVIDGQDVSQLPDKSRSAQP
jgi:H+/Cl- antiporter ClcA/PII-like signaling protein